MRKNILYFFAVLAMPFSLAAQECDCAENFEWVKKTFEENDAGYQYIIDQKGQNAYAALNDKTAAEAKNVNTLSGCQALIVEWSKFFRSGHFGFSIIKKGYYDQSTVIDPKIISIQPVVKVDFPKFEKRVNSIKVPTLEGIWSDGTYKVGIVQTKEGYQGFIIDASKTSWKPNQLKFKITSDSQNADLFMRDFSKRENVKVELVGNNLINIGNILYLKRESKSYEDNQVVKTHLRFLYAGQKPYFEQLSEKTAYIRIPTFDLQYKKQIDSVIVANSNSIEKTPNLIIDVRYNGGGADICYEKLIPFLYTDPIRTVGVQHLSTPLNNKMMLSLSQNENFDKEHQDAYKEAYELLNKNIGKFVSLSDEIIKVKKLDRILPYPENIAVIINNGNASTTEQFLLAAKQSKKTKLFGSTTSGALDISNMNDAASPDGNFELSYCRSKSYRIPGMTIDGKGIQPDYYLDSSIPDLDWMTHAQKIVEE